MNTPKHIPTAAQVLARQKADAARDHAQKQHQKAAAVQAVMQAVAPKTAAPPAVASPQTPAEYIDAIAPAAVVGRMIKFSKEGSFTTADDGEVVSPDADYICLADQTLVGWIRYHEDSPPDRVMGALYDRWVMPARETLGDTDPAGWATGISGQPEDPWKHCIYLVLQNVETSELATFVTQSVTGRRAVGQLLRHYDRTLRQHPDMYPVVRLKTGGFNHRDERVGWVSTPTFAVVGRAPKDSAAKPDTSPGGDNDEIGF